MSGAVDTVTFTEALAGAIQRGYGDEPSAVKRVARAARANVATAKNWVGRKCAPSGPHLIELMRESDEVFAEVMRLSGRADVADRAEIAAQVERLRRLLAAQSGDGS